MASPFPGMDPYLELEGFWADFHSRFMNAWCEAIADALPPDYEASLGESVYLVENDPEARKLGFPDIAVTKGREGPGPAPGGSSLPTLEPVTIPLTVLEGPRQAYIEILHRPERSLVAVLELLSPANKEQPGRTEYLVKRRALLYQQVHLVELDLLLGGRRLPLANPLPPADYYYLLSRGDQRPNCQVYHWNLPDRLPTLPVPLRTPDVDRAINLATVFTTAYDRGRFLRRLPYAGPPPTYLRKDDRRWAEAILNEAKGSMPT